ncbi:putative chymopapain protein [Helianthus annuus]|nr:putative chymopapain protein [Helianthus annuus]KAJ0631649.1 putative chymopapain protein [Helianthus annuus]KAJ0825394.1 putative chymopapain protein [Helianthus annuus]
MLRRACSPKTPAMKATSNGWLAMDAHTRMLLRRNDVQRFSMTTSSTYSHSNNAMNKGYKLAVNEFAELTNEEFRTARNRFKAHECSPSTSAFRYENVTAVPSSMDWRKKGAVTC